MSRYEVEKVKKLFDIYQKLSESNLCDEEYEQFCSEIAILPRDIVDRVKKEIYFVLLSAQKANIACLVPLSQFLNSEYKDKKALIVITPLVFGNESKNIRYCEGHNILHEIAHYVLGHFEYSDYCDLIKKENDAKEMVSNWWQSALSD
jgi:hypothetical protein